MNAESLHKGWVALEVSARMGGRMCGVFMGCGDGFGLYHVDRTGDGCWAGLDCMHKVNQAAEMRTLWLYEYGDGHSRNFDSDSLKKAGSAKGLGI